MKSPKPNGAAGNGDPSERLEEAKQRRHLRTILNTLNDNVLKANVSIKETATGIAGIFKPILSSLRQIERDLHRRPHRGSNCHGNGRP